MARRIQEPQAGGMLMVGADGGGGSFVSGEQLKQVDVPVEAVLGAANGAVSGAIVSGIVSAATTVATHNRNATESLGKAILRNVTSTHLGGLLAGVATFAALGAVVRYSRASKHNEWSERHYAYLEQQAKGYTGREDDRKNSAPDPATQQR